MDRYWFLTWTTYGSWLPGDPRGFVSPVPTTTGTTAIHNVPGTPYDANRPALHQWASTRLQGEPILLTLEQALAIADQFRETALHRAWLLVAFAVMATHVHLVVGVEGDPEPETILRDFKSYASRTLNRRWKRPPSGTWWTESGSKRKLPNEAAILAAKQYVLTQRSPLVVWSMDDSEDKEGEGK